MRRDETERRTEENDTHGDYGNRGSVHLERRGHLLYVRDVRADGFKYFTSKNLTDWTKGGYCYKDSPWGENNFWAPEVYARNGKYYMIFTARWKEKHSLRIGVAVADSPEGEFKDLWALRCSISDTR